MKNLFLFDLLFAIRMVPGRSDRIFTLRFKFMVLNSGRFNFHKNEQNVVF
jgi:hypothetical protein